MKRFASLMIGMFMVLSLTACGGGDSPASEETKGSAAGSSAVVETAAGSSAAVETEAKKTGSAKARKIENPEGYEYKFGDDAVLLDTENVHINAKKLKYKDGVLTFSANMRDKTGTDLRGEKYWIKGEDVKKGGFKSAAGKDDGFRMADVEDWNQMIGETEDCFLGTFYLFVKKGDEVIEKIKFDTYLSEKTPFVNIVSGDSVVLPEDVKMRSGKKQKKSEEEIAAEKAAKEEAEAKEKARAEKAAEKKAEEEEKLAQLQKEVDAALAGRWTYYGATAFTFDNGKVTRTNYVGTADEENTYGTYVIDAKNSRIRVTINGESGSTSFDMRYIFEDGKLTFTNADKLTRE